LSSIPVNPGHWRTGSVPGSARRFPLLMLAVGGGLLVLVFMFMFVWRGRRRRRARCRTWRRTLQRAEQGLAVRAAQSGTGVPARACRVAAVVALGDVAEAFFAEAIEHGVGGTQRMAELLVQARHQRGPQRCDRAGATDDLILAVDQHVVAGERIRVAGDIRHA